MRVCGELLTRSKPSTVAFFFSPGMGQRGPIQVAVQTHLQLLNRDGMWLTQEPPCRFSTRITSEFELGTWTDEGDFWFIFLRRWCNLRLRWSSCRFQSFVYIVGFFVASFDFILFFKVATRENTPHQTLLSGETEVFLHDRCVPHQNLIRQVWASVCVCVCACACVYV